MDGVETLMAGTQCTNVLTDLSSSNSWLTTQVPPLDLAGALQAALTVFGPERILFGTDSSTFPRGWRHEVLAATLAAFDRLALPEPQRQADDLIRLKRIVRAQARACRHLRVWPHQRGARVFRRLR